MNQNFTQRRKVGKDAKEEMQKTLDVICVFAYFDASLREIASGRGRAE